MKHIHFIAIGGSIMHQLAIALKEKGYQVSGSDDDFYEPARSNLQQHHLLPRPGWDASRITADLDAVILGMHARADNPELQKARELAIPVYSFPEYIYEESTDKTRVVIGGSHGKTTITAMIMHVLQHSGRNFDFLAGAPIPGFDHSVKLSEAPLIICEGDEYPASALKKEPKFLFYHPQIAVLSGIAWDHINVFPTLELYIEQFARFIRQMAAGSRLIYNATDQTLAALVDKEGGHLDKRPYQMPQHQITDGQTRVHLAGHSATLQVFGAHNLLNLQAAAEVCAALGINAAEFLSAIQDFRGAARRLEQVSQTDNGRVFRDFAHAPSKVAASIAAVKTQYPGQKLTALLELHTYSSLNKDFLPQYAHSMDPADIAAVFYSPHALAIKKLPPLSPEQVREGFQRQDLHVLGDTDSLEAFLTGVSADHNNLLLMSSGSFGELPVTEILKRWEKKPEGKP